MLAIASTLAVLLALVLALLAVPVVLMVDAGRDDRLEARWRVRWLFSLVDVRWSRRQPSRAASAPSGVATTPVRTSPARRKRRLRMAIAALRTRGLPGRVGRLAWTLLRQAKLETFHVRTAFGFDNPADTGIVYGLLSPMLMFATALGLNLECRPMFEESGVRGVVSAQVQVRPLSVAGPLIAFLCSPSVIRAAGAAWRARK
jgi:hypothetical protein